MTHSPVTVAAAVQKGKTDGPAVPRRKSNLVVLGGSMVIDGGEGSVVQTLFPVIQAALLNDSPSENPTVKALRRLRGKAIAAGGSMTAQPNSHGVRSIVCLPS